MCWPLIAVAALLVPGAHAARPATSAEKRSLVTALRVLVCPQSPRTLRACREDEGSGGPVRLSLGFKDIHVLLASVNPRAGDDGSYRAGVAVVSFKWRQMEFKSDNSYKGGSWVWSYRSRWEQDHKCIVFNVQGARVGSVDWYNPPSADPDALQPVLRLYGNRFGRCPVVTKARKGVAPGWKAPAPVLPVSVCEVHGRSDASDSYPDDEDYLIFRLKGPGAANLCAGLTQALTRDIYGSMFSPNPQPGEANGVMRNLCAFEITSKQLGNAIGEAIAPASYSVEIRGGATWLATGDIFHFEFGTGACE